MLEEKCGVVAYYSPESKPILTRALTAAYGVQHRGQGGFGLGFITEAGNFVSFRRPGLLADTFKYPLKFEEGDTPFELSDKTQMVLVHTRYGTNGGNETGNLQPCTAKAPNGDKVAVIHNGEFTNVERLKSSVSKEFKSSDSDTYIYTHFLAESPGNNWDEKVMNSLSAAPETYFLAILVGRNMYIARSEMGIRPGFLGKEGDDWIAASETHSLDKVGAKVVREVKRGEVIKISEEGLKVLKDGLDGAGNFCGFERDYFGRPESLMPTYEQPDDWAYPERWLSNELFRERCGQILAEEMTPPELDFMVGVPDSGIAFGTSLAHALRAPYRQLIIRDHYNENGAFRLFQNEDIDGISDKVLGKLRLIPDRRIWKDKKVGFADDSIVRGKESERITQEAYELGAAEVHWFSGYPMVRFGCHLGISMRTDEELIASRNHGDVHAIANEIRATSVHYISNEGFVRAGILSGEIKRPEDMREVFLVNGGCGGCITGLHPIGPDGSVYQSKIKELVPA